MCVGSVCVVGRGWSCGGSEPSPADPHAMGWGQQGGGGPVGGLWADEM